MSTAEFVTVGPGYMPGPVEVYQWQAEFEPLLGLYRQRKPKRVLEIGTYHGGTLYYWLEGAEPGTVVVSVDSYAVGVDNRHLYSGWTPEGVTLEVIDGDSHAPDTARQVSSHAPYDWVFIDAGHYYHEVRADWDLYGPMCAPGGVTVFHDILPPSETWPSIEVEQLWREIQRAGHLNREIVADPNVAWGGLGVVFL